MKVYLRSDIIIALLLLLCLSEVIFITSNFHFHINLDIDLPAFINDSQRIDLFSPFYGGSNLILYKNAKIALFEDSCL